MNQTGVLRFFGDIPHQEMTCKKCGKVFLTSTKREYCLDCKPFPISCD